MLEEYGSEDELNESTEITSYMSQNNAGLALEPYDFKGMAFSEKYAKELMAYSPGTTESQMSQVSLPTQSLQLVKAGM